MNGHAALVDTFLIDTPTGPNPSGYFAVSVKSPTNSGNRRVNAGRILTQRLYFMVTYPKEIYINLYVLRF